MGSPDSSVAVLTICRRQVGPFHPRAPALSREVIETRHSPLQSGHCCHRAFTHRHHRRGRAPAPAPPPRGPLPPPSPTGGHASLSPYLASSLFAQAQFRSPATTSSLPAQLSGKCSCGGAVMPTELAEGSLPKRTIARGQREIKTSGYPLPTPLHTSFAPPVHSPKLTTHTRAPNLSLPEIPPKAVHPPAGWRPFLGRRPRNDSAPL